MKEYKVRTKIIIEIETTIEDESIPLPEDLEHMLMDDLQDVGGWIVNSAKTIEFDLEERT